MHECIVRMEMPKACVWRDDKGNIKMCPLYWEDEARCQGKDGKEAPWYDGKRPDWCPIICQLPEGHGRLIDADAMAKDLNYDVELDAKALDDMSIVGYARERFQFDKNRKQDCIRYLSGQKTIVPAEAERSEK